ncbi:hypothetical protein SASPL_139801 [Salvia splendens]|uniref:Uncharacterized protein n=1 Tax=Salvia splendens TaxID=180675 RepID=A0A8X8WQE1_SALSN|nr:hypothetical protein SASPL_139801 [Salvia splendens]
MVQEWQAAYVDYQGLKTLLKSHVTLEEEDHIVQSLQRPSEGIAEEVILVSSVQQEGSDQNYYQTMFLRSSDEGSQIEVEFFRKLDEEFNKVVKFYSEKVEQVKAEAEAEINVEPDAPVSTLRNMVGSSKSDLSYSKDELTKAEVQLRQAMTEFYQQLRLLKSYCFMNVLAFSKIVKKYYKITSRSASKAYLQTVDNSCLGTSDEVNKIMARIEATFIKHFANGNRRSGMKSLKPGHKREKHRTTFFLVHYFFLEAISGELPFIFGFRPGTELGFREIFLLASGLSVLSLVAVLSNLDMEIDPDTKEYSMLTELAPLTLVLVVFIITFCPFNIIYRSSRYFLIRCAWHCLCAPLYKITLPDFFLADQLTSHVCAKSQKFALLATTTFLEISQHGLMGSRRRANTTILCTLLLPSPRTGRVFFRNSRNPWLRDKLLISNKAVYFVAIVVNMLLRLVWMQLVLDFQISFLHPKGMVALIACLEILRRGMWNFFRVENEHFNNVGKYRAFKTVPLPFHYEDEKII